MTLTIVGAGELEVETAQDGTKPFVCLGVETDNMPGYSQTLGWPIGTSVQQLVQDLQAEIEQENE